jgi:hypothetical protein
MLSFYPSLRPFVLQVDRDAGAFHFPVPDLELAAAAQCPDPVSSVHVAAVQDYLFAAARQTAGLDLLRLPLGITPELDCLDESEMSISHAKDVPNRPPRWCGFLSDAEPNHRTDKNVWESGLSLIVLNL